ncbi:hypothetical protein B0H16DRAFT_1744612 [Mycena metata]|uniref:Xylanolytic transcriptional activator regulatory domain-containing protein n=1 Tax=Mycena metata TaxID=1033252 RepID=A0AAD7MDG1_9AGAR|nr:hypothetical protein B0H16DRAFT_1744612 [Mycena metata]
MSCASSSSSLFQSPPPSPSSKREYLLAQIRQKDAIIESLLKQLHNPYIATPLSIASYRMATSPSDSTNHNILAWLDRLQASVRANSNDTPTATNFASSAAASLSTAKNAPSAKSASFNNSTNPNFASNPAFEESDESEGGNERTARAHANLSLSNSRRERRNGEALTREDELDELDDDNVVRCGERGLLHARPSDRLGMRAQLIEQHSPPEILIHGLVVPEDVDKLFEIFYARVNPFIAILDPVLHTPASTFARCPFLFTVSALRHLLKILSEKSEIYPIAMHFAKHSAANAHRRLEIRRACAGLYPHEYLRCPARKWEEDRSWLYTGLAIRLATDLNLHQVATRSVKGNEKQEREMLNRTRVWMICFNLDRSTATQLASRRRSRRISTSLDGEPLKLTPRSVLRHGNEDWYKKSPYNSSFDIHMCCYTALLRVVARFHDEIFSDPASPTGLNKRVDFRTVTLLHDAKLTAFSDEWTQRFAQDSDPNGECLSFHLPFHVADLEIDRKCAMRCKLLPFLVGYSRLVMFSFGFQQAYRRGLQAQDHIFFTKCLEAGKAILRAMVEGLAPTGFMRYSPDGHFIFSAFASAFLLKLLRPEFSHLMPKEEENQVYDLIGRLIQTLSSPEIAIDDRHTPKLYARFLAGLLSRHRRDGATVGRLHPQPPTTKSVSSASSDYGHLSNASSTFTMSPMAGVGPALGHDQAAQGYGGHNYAQMEKAPTPIYRPEATYSGPIQYGTEMDLGTGLPDEEQMLAAMQALRQPAFWTNMMLPGFSWPESAGHSPPSSNGYSPPSNASNGSPPPYQYQQPQMNMQGVSNAAFNDGFHQVPQFAA